MFAARTDRNLDCLRGVPISPPRELYPMYANLQRFDPRHSLSLSDADAVDTPFERLIVQSAPVERDRMTNEREADAFAERLAILRRDDVHAW